MLEEISKCFDYFYVEGIFYEVTLLPSNMVSYKYYLNGKQFDHINAKIEDEPIIVDNMDKLKDELEKFYENTQNKTKAGGYTNIILTSCGIDLSGIKGSFRLYLRIKSPDFIIELCRLRNGQYKKKIVELIKMYGNKIEENYRKELNNLLLLAAFDNV